MAADSVCKGGTYHHKGVWGKLFSLSNDHQEDDIGSNGGESRLPKHGEMAKGQAAL